MTNRPNSVMADTVAFEHKQEAIIASLRASEITYQTGESLHSELNERAASGAKVNIVLDLAKMRLLSSEGLNVLLFLLKRVNQCGGRLAIAGLAGNALSVMRAIGFTRGFDLYPNVDTAMRALQLRIAGDPSYPGIERRSGAEARSGLDHRGAAGPRIGANRRSTDRRSGADRRKPA